MNKRYSLSLVVSISVLMSACVHVTPTQVQPDPDPLEGFNRKIFIFNKHADKYFLKPIAKGYKAILPKPVRQRVTNLFANIDDIPSAANHFLQGDLGQGAEGIGRVLVNSTLGLAGMFDVATEFGLDKNYTTFGETMVVWGGNYSPYLVLPFLGPSTVRDAAGRFPDWLMSPWPYVESDAWRYGAYGLRAIDLRATYLDKDDLVNTVSFDDYVFMRDAYLQRANRKGPKPVGGEHDPDDFESFD